jgi:hypothetical protein
MKFKIIFKNTLKFKFFFKKEERKHINNISRHKQIQKNIINTNTKNSTTIILKSITKKSKKKHIHYCLIN